MNVLFTKVVYVKCCWRLHCGRVLAEFAMWNTSIRFFFFIWLWQFPFLLFLLLVQLEHAQCSPFAYCLNCLKPRFMQKKSTLLPMFDIKREQCAHVAEFCKARSIYAEVFWTFSCSPREEESVIYITRVTAVPLPHELYKRSLYVNESTNSSSSGVYQSH